MPLKFKSLSQAYFNKFFNWMARQRKDFIFCVDFKIVLRIYKILIKLIQFEHNLIIIYQKPMDFDDF